MEQRMGRTPNHDDEPTPPTPFERFWDAYPHKRRTEKARCLRYWKRDKLDERVDHVIAVVEGMKQSRQWQDSQFIPLAPTFLNKQRWDCKIEDVQADGHKETSDEHYRNGF